jgi:hypothetical protein
MARLKSAFTDLPDAPSADLIDHGRFTAYTKTPHDVSGEPVAPIKFENKQEELWERLDRARGQARIRQRPLERAEVVAAPRHSALSTGVAKTTHTREPSTRSCRIPRVSWFRWPTPWCPVGLLMKYCTAPGRYDAEWVVVLDDWTDGVGKTPQQLYDGLTGRHTPGMDNTPGMSGVGKSDLLGGDAEDISYPYYLINGRFPAASTTFTAKPGQRIRIRIINAGSTPRSGSRLAGTR